MDFFSLNRDSLVGERGLVDLGSAFVTGVPTTGVGGAVPPLRDVLVAIVKPWSERGDQFELKSVQNAENETKILTSTLVSI